MVRESFVVFREGAENHALGFYERDIRISKAVIIGYACAGMFGGKCTNLILNRCRNSQSPVNQYKVMAKFMESGIRRIADSQ